MAPKLASLLFTLSVLLSAAHYGHCAHHSSAAAPAPSADCSSLILNMADCLSFVSAGSATTKPEGTCCSGLKSVLTTDAECLCEAFKSSASLGVTLNATKALSLPSACKVSAPSPTNCNLSVSPSEAPVMAPTEGGSETAGSNMPAPAPAPGVSSSSVRTISLGPLVVASLLALLFSTY